MPMLPWCLCALHCLSEHRVGVSVSQVPLPSAVVGLVGTGWTDRDPAMPLLQGMQGWFPPRGTCFSPRRRSSVYLAARQHKRMINFRANTDPFRYGWNSPQKYLEIYLRFGVSQQGGKMANSPGNPLALLWQTTRKANSPFHPRLLKLSGSFPVTKNVWKLL